MLLYNDFNLKYKDKNKITDKKKIKKIQRDIEQVVNNILDRYVGTIATSETNDRIRHEINTAISGIDYSSIDITSDGVISNINFNIDDNT